MQVPAVLGVGTEGIKNGGFNSQGDWSTSSTATIENGALRLTGSANVTSSQLVKNIIGGNTYTFTGKYMTTGKASAYLTIQYRVPYGWERESFGFTGSEHSSGQIKSKKTDAYDVHTVEITAPKHTTEIVIQLRKVGNTAGDVFWDDVSLTGVYGETKLEENPFKADAAGTAELRLDEVFYYTDKTTATATVKTGLSADKVTYTLYEGMTRKWEKTENYGKPFSFALSSLKEETQYKLSAKVKKGSGTVAEGEQIFYRVKRPTALDADGKYYAVTVDKNTGTATKAAEATEPIFLYTVGSGGFAKAKEGGINVVQGYASVLDAAAAAGLKVLVVLYSPNPEKTLTSMLPAGHPNNVAHTRSIIHQYKHHEAVYGWLVMDEPYYNLVSREAGPRFKEAEVNTWLLNSYRVIHEEDPHHPVFIMQDGSARYRQAAMGTDILGIDPYIQTNGNVWHDVYSAVVKAKMATKGEKPVYACLQAFRFSGFLPETNQLRHMAYQARLAGALGIGYYQYSNADGDTALPNTRLWNDVLRIKNEKDILFGIDKTEIRDHGLYGETKDGKGVILYMGEEKASVLTATYQSGAVTELTDLNIEALSDTEKLQLYDSTANQKRFIWTDGQGFLAPGV